ncbi:4-hydroxybenzoyl-CoA thioesterase [Insulibacter thermoxylanivorax]|uniref:4-hydroxybenzoyl-CoA thioesterase n=1 Tax=Insulibacter thermoxylanivorax TaxID=2749268 RepID=A0A916QER7_9BACL|nr:thioesterase family protein [Insulibacter thermoxylanivorax]GFR38083.1 4-hydroxybenzoyl-CoA thioesterase [Insulibacter thermoxylanivorax]
MPVSDWYTCDLTARYAETDRMGVIYHANYLTWFEIGRTEMIRELGYPYRKIEELGLLLPVVDLDMQFIKPAYYDDRIRISTRITDFTNIRLNFEVRIERLDEETFQAAELLVTGRTRHVWLNNRWKSARIDREAPELYALIKRACHLEE